MESNNIKNELTEIVTLWLINDKKIKELNKELKEARNYKRHINEKLIVSMKNNNLPTLNISSGQIQYKQKTKLVPLNKKNIFSMLQEHSILSTEQIADINICLQNKNNRPQIITESIVYKNNH